MFWKIESINLDYIEEDVNYINVYTNKTPIQIWILKVFLTSWFIVVSNNFLQVLISFQSIHRIKFNVQYVRFCIK
jgi:hypothetical protein